MPTPFEEKRQGVLVMNLQFIMSARAGDIFQHFRIVAAGPVNELQEDTIVYYGFHPGFEPFEGAGDAVPMYHPYWDDEGKVYFKLATMEVPDVS